MERQQAFTMLQPIMHILETKTIVLASGSESRKEIFRRNLGLKVHLYPSNFKENLRQEDFNTFSEFVEETALQKVLEVESRLKSQGEPADIIIGADTMVAHEKTLLGKAKTEDEAYQMLSSLSGDSNTVYTGVVIRTKEGKMAKFTDKTHVYFGQLTEDQIRSYLATGEYKGKAGSYAIQGFGSALVERIEGNYYNIMGLSVFKFCKALNNLFIEIV